MTQQTDMEIALEQVRRAAQREAHFYAPGITKFMGYTPQQILAMHHALERITAACEQDAGVPTPDDGDDEAVGSGTSGPMALTFGMLRRARAALIEV